MKKTMEQQQMTQPTNVEQQQRRNLKIAQAQKQKEQYTQSLTKNIKDSKYKTPKTDAQQKQTLKKRQNLHARLIKARNRKKKRKIITRKYQKIIKKYQKTSWTLLYVVAFADAIIDVLSIPILSTILSFIFSFYINAVLWNIGSKNKRAKRRIIRAGASILDLIPIINLIPVSILIIYNTKERERKRVKKAKKILKKLS